MKIISAEFMTSAVNGKQFPNSADPEFAFIGRSNVGKSSLINSLLNRKKLVKTSATPGKTQMINFFSVNDRMIFTDLPGYGFAKVPDDVKRKWQNLVEQYLINRENLRAVVLLLDIRRKPTDLDLHMKQWLEEINVDHILVATKSDKLKQNERSKQLKKIREAFVDDNETRLIPYSSKDNLGRKELWTLLGERLA